MSYQKIGLIGAMNEEIELLLADMQHNQRSDRAGITFYEGNFHGKEVVLCRSGVGKVNAAVTTQILIDAYGVDCILFTGVAGALHPELNIGDIVVSTSCMQHDMDVSALGFARGVIPYQEQSEFLAAPDLVEKAEAACQRLFDGRYRLGKVLSGDQFVASRELVRELHESMNGICTEMEGAAVAQVCNMNGTPFVVIRSMSDRADGSAHVNFGEFTVQAAKHSYQIIDDVLSHI
ncbi:5'-methylthioadenosine/S-adenosylhomocysteine nucleosidase [Paenibacillus selenitireducens]|uniref:adenosylhomocysteine nucleosidase n=1 Tax=Paenibacillus selenitireducens TaxID=1324314 RepID=A0A1T2XF76_9BACL|nr:5'-methylthioadenosine/adenosylhomocysteine nucleosidase [Paenibacillus selenitireducens]OPA78544.1 5'-methylthioadenosine/S-adenosylhomocysteine nucleosidase [Paenibacillus selenitireducens]